MSNYFTYITTNPRKTVLYTGMTNDLEQRIVEHYLNRGNPKTFTGKYHCYYLIYFERFDTPQNAIWREKEIKRFSRKEKEELIENQNADWKFLNAAIMDWPPHPDQTARS